MSLQDGSASQSSKRQASLELDVSSKRAKVASAIEVDGTSETGARDLTQLSPEEHDRISSIVPNHTTSPQSTVTAQRADPFSETSSTEYHLDVPSLSIHTTPSLLISIPDNPKPPLVHSELLDRELQTTTSSNGQLTQISAGVDKLTTRTQSAFDGIQTEMEKNRGEISLARGEMHLMRAKDTQSKTRDKQRYLVDSLPLVPGAAFDGSLGCLDTTRTELLVDIIKRLTTEETTKNVFILSGPAGSGKTAIAHSVAHICNTTHRSLASSFFFKAGVSLRDRPDQLVSSIARGLAAKNSNYASFVSEAIENDPGLATAPIQRQFQTLLTSIASQLPTDTHPVAMVIDAIDEGWSEDLLEILESWAQLPSWIRLFVTFRDDGSVPHRLRVSPHIDWRDLDIASKSNHDDIRTYLAQKLHKIAANRDLHGWPTLEDIEKMCRKANGLFVWAAVACNSIGEVDLDPIEQFNELLDDDVIRDTQAADQMDELYLKVLSKCQLNDARAQSRYQQCFGAVLSVRRPLSVGALNELLGVSHTFPTLRRLAPIMPGLLPPGSDTPIQVIHQSLRQFATRAPGRHALLESDQNAFLALRCLLVIHEQLPSLVEHTQWITDGKREGQRSLPLLPERIASDALEYACQFMMDHLTGVEHLSAELSGAIELFLRQNLFGWLALCTLKGKCQDIRVFLEWTQSRNLIPDARTVILTHNESFPNLMAILSGNLGYEKRLNEALLCADVAALFGPPVTNDPRSESLRATVLEAQSDCLSDLGHWEEALKLTLEAVTIRRDLAHRNPTAFNLSLAHSLNNLSNQFSGVGQWEEALKMIQEAVYIYRGLLQQNPTTSNVNLACSLYNLADRLSSLGRQEDALDAIQEAVHLYRNIAQRSPTVPNPDLADSLQSFSNRLSKLGRREEALATIQEAEHLYRDLVKRYPTAFNPALANSLHNLSNQLSQTGQREKALEAIQEAVTIQRDLALQYPTAFNSDLSGSLHQLSDRLSHLGRREQALRAIQEAVTIRHGLAQRHPAFFSSYLACSLNALSTRLSDVGQLEESLRAIHESVAIERDLVQQRPMASNPNLAHALHDLSNRLLNYGERKASLKAMQEVVSIRRGLAQQQPTIFNPDLANSLSHLSCTLSDLGQQAEALEAVQEAVDLYRDLVQQLPTNFNPDLALSLYNLAVTLRAGTADDIQPAYLAAIEAEEIYCPLAKNNPLKYKIDWGDSLELVEQIQNQAAKLCVQLVDSDTNVSQPPAL